MRDKILRFEITDKCNMRCKMCWSKEWTHKDMDEEKVKEIVRNFKKSGGKTVVLTSREPLLSNNFELIIDLCKAENLDLKLLTNATLITDKIAKCIIESNVVSFIAISIHGNYDEHDSITGVTGSLQRTIEGIEKLNKYKKLLNVDIPEIRLTTVVSNNVIDSIDFIINTAKENKTQLRIQHYMWHPKNIKEAHKKFLKENYNVEDNIIDGFPSECDIDSQRVIDMLKYARTKCEDKKIDLQIYPKMTEEEIKRWYNKDCDKVLENGYCQHVKDSIRLRANGEVSLCQYIDIIIGHIEDTNMEDIIYNDLLNKIGVDLENGKIFPICNRCCHIESKELTEDIINNSKI